MLVVTPPLPRPTPSRPRPGPPDPDPGSLRAAQTSFLHMRGCSHGRGSPPLAAPPSRRGRPSPLAAGWTPRVWRKGRGKGIFHVARVCDGVEAQSPRPGREGTESRAAILPREGRGPSLHWGGPGGGPGRAVGPAGRPGSAGSGCPAGRVGRRLRGRAVGDVLAPRLGKGLRPFRCRNWASLPSRPRCPNCNRAALGTAAASFGPLSLGLLS